MRRRISRIGLLVAGLAMGASEARADPLEAALPVELPIFGYNVQFSHEAILMCVATAVLVWLFCKILGSSLSKDSPGRGQVLLEMIYKAFRGLCEQSIGLNRGPKYLPYIGTLFLFLWTANMIGLIPFPTSNLFIGGEHYTDYNGNHRFDPGEWNPAVDDANKDGKQNPGFPVPKFKEPTENVNIPFALAFLFVLFIGHGSELRIHGVVGYLKSYFSPGGIIGLVMFPLNVVGKVAEIVSISFRLFGNIFGGVVIMVVVSGLVGHFLLPIGLFGFFGVFVGTIQAFVFTMLALTYISLGAAESEE